MNWLPIALMALGGFLIGGVVSLWRADSRPAAMVVAAFAGAAVVGGAVWLIR